MQDPADRSNEQEAKSQSSTGEQVSQTRASGKGPDWSGTLMLVLGTVVGSVIIAVYVLAVNVLSPARKEVNVIEEGALKAAQRLTLITVEHANFGRVGLCDLERLPVSMDSMSSANQVRVVGIHSLFDTLHIDENIAKSLNHPVMLKLAKQDIALAHRVETDLVRRLRQAVEPDTVETTPSQNYMENSGAAEQENTIYRDLHRMISNENSNSSSILEMRIKLGTIKHPVLITQQNIRLVDPDEFEPTDESGSAPNLVLVEASYESKSKDGTSGTIIKRACAVIAAEAPTRKPSAFVITFPDGVPPQFRCARDILDCGKWPAKGGWQQAVGSEVPGRGSLAPPLEPVLPEMTPSDAMAVALYHWLRDLGPGIDAKRLQDLLSSKWTVDKTRNEKSNIFFQAQDQDWQFPVNSCLARDTGAREYAVMNQTGPGGIGQIALGHALGVYSALGPQSKQNIFPQSALPLLVDADGKLNISGRDGFDQALVKDFLDKVYATNIAAIESLSCAQLLTQQSSSLISQIEQRVFIEKQELASLANRLGHQSKPPPKVDSNINEQPAHIAQLTNERIEALKKAIANDEEQRNVYAKIQHLCSIVRNNATRTATATFDLCTHSFKLCREGLYRIDRPESAFLVGKNYVFIPHTSPMTESDFYQAARRKEMAQASQPNNAQPQVSPAEAAWLSQKLDTVLPLDSAFTGNQKNVIVEGRPLKDILEQKPTVKPAPALMITLDSSELASSVNPPTVHAYRKYPFFNIPVPSGQLFYYCQTASQNGNEPKVSWSMLIRDLVATKHTTAGEVATGEPISSSERGWCQQGEPAASECPDLACELQIRSPLPVLDTLTGDSYLANPTANMRAAQIPPVPPDML
jgi:hypothetical protein